MIVERSEDGSTLRIKPQGEGDMQSAGSGEQQLWSMLAAMGPMKPDDAKAWMDGFIPPARR